MIRVLLYSLLSAPMFVPTGIAFAQDTMQFPDATETVPELIELWEGSNAICRGANGGDVKVAAECLSRSVYGVALNERNWCLGETGQSNAEMTWHECDAASLRFPPFIVPVL